MRLMKPNLVHGCISEDHILPLSQECLSSDFTSNLSSFSSLKFPNGQGIYLKVPGTYQVLDDLTVTPFCIVSILSSLSKQKIPVSDVKEVELQIGLKEFSSSKPPSQPPSPRRAQPPSSKKGHLLTSYKLEKRTSKMPDAKEAEFSLNVLINKEKTKVLFAEADSHFVDILLSFLTLPLGRIVKVLEKHYGDEAPNIGSLSSLYHGLANLDNAHFWTEGAKQTLLNPASSFEAEYERLKLNITDSQPAEYFVCEGNSGHRFRSSMYYDNVMNYCLCTRCRCYYIIKKVVVEKGSEAACSDGVFTIHTASFIISDDLQILPNETELLKILGIVGVTDAVKAEPIKVTFGFSEIMSLLKASLTSQTPLSDLILNKTRPANSVTVDSEAEFSLNHIGNLESKQMILEVVTQKSTGKLLYAKAKEDFVEFLFCLLHIPVGGVEHLLSGKTCFKAINNLYRSTTELIDDEYFKTLDTKSRLMKPNLVHGCISKDHILPLVEESLPAGYSDISKFSSVKFPKGKGRYVEGPRTYQVMDDLTVTPFCVVSIFSSLDKQNIPISDVKEVELQIGLKEALNILKASLTSTSALTDALLNHISIKEPKTEV